MASIGQRVASGHADGADSLAERAPFLQRVVSRFGRRLELQQDNKTQPAEPRKSWVESRRGRF